MSLQGIHFDSNVEEDDYYQKYSALKIKFNSIQYELLNMRLKLHNIESQNKMLQSLIHNSLNMKSLILIQASVRRWILRLDKKVFDKSVVT